MFERYMCSSVQGEYGNLYILHGGYPVKPSRKERPCDWLRNRLEIDFRGGPRKNRTDRFAACRSSGRTRGFCGDIVQTRRDIKWVRVS